MNDSTPQTIFHPYEMPEGALSANLALDIMREITDAHDRLSGIGPAVSIFGSARLPRNGSDCEAARTTARLLSQEGYAIISGGGPSIMEAVNQGAQEGGSPSIGLNIWIRGQEKGPNSYQDICLNFHHFFARKMIFMKFASAFVVMPGGVGTMDELMDSLTLLQTGKVAHKPVILVNRRFWSGLIDWMRDKLLAMGTISEKDFSMFCILDRPEEIRDAIVEAGRQG